MKFGKILREARLSAEKAKKDCFSKEMLAYKSIKRSRLTFIEMEWASSYQKLTQKKIGNYQKRKLKDGM